LQALNLVPSLLYAADEQPQSPHGNPLFWQARGHRDSWDDDRPGVNAYRSRKATGRQGAAVDIRRFVIISEMCQTP
jgi:hypothetical protein